VVREKRVVAQVTSRLDPLGSSPSKTDVMEIEKQPAVFPSGAGAKPVAHTDLQNQAG